MMYILAWEMARQTIEDSVVGLVGKNKWQKFFTERLVREAEGKGTKGNRGKSPRVISEEFLASLPTITMSWLPPNERWQEKIVRRLEHEEKKKEREEAKVKTNNESQDEKQKPAPVSGQRHHRVPFRQGRTNNKSTKIDIVQKDITIQC